MKKIILIFGIVTLFLISGCSTSYQDCVEDCRINNYDRICNNSIDLVNSIECHFGSEMDNICYNECRPK